MVVRFGLPRLSGGSEGQAETDDHRRDHRHPHRPRHGRQGAVRRIPSSVPLTSGSSGRSPHVRSEIPARDAFPPPHWRLVVLQRQGKRAVGGKRTVLDELPGSQSGGEGAGHAEPEFGGDFEIRTVLRHGDSKVGEFLVDVAASARHISDHRGRAQRRGPWTY